MDPSYAAFYLGLTSRDNCQAFYDIPSCASDSKCSFQDHFDHGHCMVYHLYVQKLLGGPDIPLRPGKAAHQTNWQLQPTQRSSCALRRPSGLAGRRDSHRRWDMVRLGLYTPGGFVCTHVEYVCDHVSKPIPYPLPHNHSLACMHNMHAVCGQVKVCNICYLVQNACFPKDPLNLRPPA